MEGSTHVSISDAEAAFLPLFGRFSLEKRLPADVVLLPDSSAPANEGVGKRTAERPTCRYHVPRGRLADAGRRTAGTAAGSGKRKFGSPMLTAGAPEMLGIVQSAVAIARQAVDLDVAQVDPQRQLRRGASRSARPWA